MTSFRHHDAKRRRNPKRPEKLVASPKTHDRTPESSKMQRLPFFVWVLLVSVYLCIMLESRSRRFNFARDHIAITRQQSNTLQQHQQQQQSRTPLAADRIVHVIQTRFMQHQPYLTTLAFARLALFETFCLPSILAQTSNNFIWIIRVDPKLSDEILGRMKESISHRENIILLGSNYNPEGMGRDSTDFDHFLGLKHNNEDESGIVHSGNVTLLREAFEISASSSSSVLLETRLDADDALHKMYVEFIQNQAQHYLANNYYVGEDTSDQFWRLWCVNSNVEWHPLNPYPVPTDEASMDKEGKEEGYLLMYADKGICTTPGLTFGYGIGATRASILEGRRLKHSDIAATISHCDGEMQVKCVSRLLELSPGALRARTATSAGMVNVITGNDRLDQSSNGLKQKKDNKQLIEQFSQQDILWDGVERLFSVTKTSVRDVRSLIVSRMKYIAADNLKGLCTKGHSCKENGKVLLNAIINKSEE